MALRINIPPATRTCLVSLITLSLLYNIARWRQIDSTGKTPTVTPIVPYLTLVPSKFFFYPWTLLSATFVEQNIFTVLLNAATLFYGGKYLERAWGSREFAKFIVVIAVIPNVVVVFTYLLWSIIRGSTVSGLTQICGGISIQASFLVAFKQLVPEHTVTIFKGLVKMRVKHFPALFLLLNTISGVAFGTQVAALLAWLGLLASWSYLRFYKRQPDLTGTSTDGQGIKGDASETFAFACLFPDVIQPPIAFVADQIYSFLVAVKICIPFSEEDIASGNQQVLARGEAGLPSLLNSQRGGGMRGMGKREEAERRRALALKALDQRLQAAAAGRAQSQASTVVQPGPPQSHAAAPTVSAGQSMLGETSYTPDHG
ncbi:rhomboid family protein [Aspergillus clavatus NRRL 1]|uniref:Rhomboid family protein, putative n=1 Tax=Aspergillus clavatus (strain ATCC 1007 / CBS 513.65 / DSM 816 / NCTC 3887 / NRRL 1 / QM 1276 / 107) TaxID=344612 RepID=A1CUA2_ASPCL|nr:rhomboid family protein, putative [Aspergillus clavatus NRRL 1]EAW06889.1 rhomboid family protein, putative [Aspergillus clavatus NRRL 1]